MRRLDLFLLQIKVKTFSFDTIMTFLGDFATSFYEIDSLTTGPFICMRLCGRKVITRVRQPCAAASYRSYRPMTAFTIKAGRSIFSTMEAVYAFLQRQGTDGSRVHLTYEISGQAGW
jgi:hypothetical protein